MQESLSTFTAVAGELPYTEHEFRERLAKLSRVALALTHCSSLDELWRSAIELGLRDLHFDRLGLWLVSDVPGMLKGAFGTDEQGQVRDERGQLFVIMKNELLLGYIQQQESRHAYRTNTAIYDLNQVQVGEGWLAVAGLWDGEAAIGYLFADNLLRQLPYSEHDGELLSLYASTLGRLCTHLRIEETLHHRRTAASAFLSKMAALNKLAARLTRSVNLDELCRNAIVLGRQELGFDRLGLWFSGEEPDTIVGTYGTDEAGNLRDERGLIKHFDEFGFPLGQALRSKERYAFKTGIIVHSLDGEPLRYGWTATAALWDGEEIIGYLFTDNLLQQLSYSEHDGELLALYALLLGHLCTRQRIEEELREREASYRALIDAIPDFLFVVTRAGMILDYHAAQPVTLNALPVQIVNQSLRDILHPKLADQYLQAIEEVLQTGEVITLDHPLSYGESLYHFETRIAAAGQDKVVALVRDVTNRKQLEEQLYASQKMESLGRMASGIAHDFNNLLTVIQGSASVAESHAAGGAPSLRKALTRILSASEKGARLTNQLLLFARKQVVQTSSVDVNGVIRGMGTILTSLLGEDIELYTELNPLLGEVQIDPGQFEQVIINLALNARDAMPQGGRFTIRTRSVVRDELDAHLRFNALAGNYILIEVSDSGVGIDYALQKKIFDPFFTTKETGKGTGLGLAICQGIVEQSGGYIRVQSAPNQGATFQIFLPQVQIPALATTQPPSEMAVAGAETILLVEDDEPVRAVAVEMLSSYGYTILECAAGVEAVQTARDYSQPINLLMTDMVMPQMNGREVAEQFMQLRPGVPVLLVSGYVGELPENLVNQSNVTFLPKPYTLPLLTKTVRTILDQHFPLH